MTPEDLDHTIADGLGLRWAFMGPFETIELNAPGGIPDYCRRYVAWFSPLRWPTCRRRRSGTRRNWTRAAQAWPRPLDADADRRRRAGWRDERLAALVAHKRAQRSPESHRHDPIRSIHENRR